MKLEDFISKLDSDRFGFNIAKINNYVFEIEKTLNFLKENNVKLIISRVPLNNLKLLNELEKKGFEIKDIQATYKYKLINIQHNFAQISDEVKLRNAELKDSKELELIALDSFKNYGHYSANDKLDKNKCNEIYGDWITRSLTNSKIADKIIVAEVDNEIAGFLSFKKHTNNEGNYAAGGIGAVNSKYRSQDIFKKISFEGLVWGKSENLDWIEHNVLITNYPVNRSFAKQGFVISDTYATLHKWLE